MTDLRVVPEAPDAIAAGKMADEVVCVIGMHRSGTSLITRILNLLGVGLGPEEELMPPHQHDNPAGYWENETVVGLNDRIFDLLGGSWDNPPALPPGWEYTPALGRLRPQAREVLDTIRADTRLAAFKDPRASVLLPFWKTVAPITGAIVAVRHPFQVAASLASRDRMHSEDAARLWTRHMVDGWRNHPHRIVVSFDAAVEDPVLCAVQMADFLDLDPPSDRVLDQVKGFVDPNLRHHADFVPHLGPNMALALAVFAIIESQPVAMVDRVFEAVAADWLVG